MHGALLVTLLSHLAQPAAVGMGDGVHLCPFKDEFSLSWLTHLPQIAEDAEIYAKRKKGPGWEVRKRMGSLPRDAHRPELGTESTEETDIQIQKKRQRAC